jgi:hypothetical protein
VASLLPAITPGDDDRSGSGSIAVVEEGAIALDVDVDVPRPRRRGDPALAELEGRILERLLGHRA